VRILHIDSGEQMQGGQWQVLHLLEGLVLQGLTAILLAPATSTLFGEALKKSLDVRPLSVFELRKLATSVDVIHAHDAKAHTLCALSGGAPVVVSRRVSFPVRTGAASRWKYRRATLFLAVSKFAANQLVQAGIPEDRIRVVYDGVQIPPLTSRGPGHVVALAAKPVQIPGISVDHTTSLLDALRTASVFVYRSNLEGLGSAALLAQAAGVPVVASAAGGLTEAVVEGRTGYLVRDDDFATPVNRLLHDPVLAEKMGQSGRERVQKDFSTSCMIERTMRAYGELVS
jgi:hypothetical protein